MVPPGSDVIGRAPGLSTSRLHPPEHMTDFEPRPRTLSLGYGAQCGVTGLKVPDRAPAETAKWQIESLRELRSARSRARADCLSGRASDLGLARCLPQAPW